MIHADVTSEKLFGLKTVMVSIHLGKIIDVTQSSVWIEPVQQRSSLIQDSATMTLMQTVVVTFVE